MRIGAKFLAKIELTAEDILDAWNAVRGQEKPADETPFGPYEESMEGANENGVNESASEAAKVTHLPKEKGKKRKMSEDMLAVCEILEGIGNKRIGYEFDVKATKKEAFDILDGIHGMSLQQKFIVCGILAKELDKLDVFMDMCCIFLQNWGLGLGLLSF